MIAIRRTAQNNSGKNAVRVEGRKTLAAGQRLELLVKFQLDGPVDPIKRL